ncbi:MAG: DUF4123 domain-containing protein [Pyrinomonadaceae bacterium]|nr:DUF4123 domain-containing protein [Pyrinomonadaceae bacterium]
MAKAELENLLFREIANVFAVVDGASIERLPVILHETKPPHYCLMRGELSPDLAEVAPYVVGLVRGAPFTDWILQQPLGRNIGIFATTRQSIREIRKHFRGLFTVYKENGDPMHFRYYDPRVIHKFLPTCEPDEIKTFFGPIDRYIAEEEGGAGVVVYSHDDGILKRSSIKIDNERS